MINFLSNWTQQIAVAVIIVSIFEMIIPKGNLKKYIKVILGIYVVFSIISPFVDNKVLYSIDLPEEIGKYSKDQEHLNKQKNKINFDEIYADTLENEIKQTVENQGYEIYKCTVEGVFNANKNDAGIKKIEIVLKNRKPKSKEEKNTDIDNVKDVEKVEIIIGKTKEENNNEITEKDINELKKYLSEYYEIEQKIFEIKAN